MLRVLVALGCFWAWASGAPSLGRDVEPAQFARLPAIQSATLSPDGGAIAYVTHDQERQGLVVMEIEDGSRQFLPIPEGEAEHVFWHGSDLVLVRVRASERARFQTGAVGFSLGRVDGRVLLAVNRQDLSGRQLMDRVRQSNEMTATSRFGNVQGTVFTNRANVVGRHEPTGRLILDFNRNLILLDPREDSWSTYATGTDNTVHWAVNTQGTAIARTDYEPGRNRVSVRIRTQDQTWRELWSFESQTGDWPVWGFSPAGDALIVRTPDGPGGVNRLRLLPLDGADAPGPVYVEAAGRDVVGLRRGAADNEILGVVFAGPERRAVWFDPRLAEVQERLANAAPGAFVTLTSWSEDLSRFVVVLESGASAPEYYLYHADEERLSRLGSAWPELSQQRLAMRRMVSAPARDGTQIPVYVTLPEGEGPHGFVVLPHGGPHARDRAGFDPMAHFIAAMGYGVLQPQFRGSTGFGEAWKEAGFGQWGLGVMQTDLEDTLAWAVGAGLADPDRVCIAGGSYGGYAALAGAAYTPELFQCAIGINGVYDLDALLRSDDRAWWRQSMGGDPERRPSSSYLAERSPRRAVDQIDIPILLIHADHDTVVDDEQGVAMDRALRRAGKDVRYIEIDGGDHWLSDYPTRLRVFEAMGAFLNENLGPAPSPEG
jgi:dipeptidyl aminopeptidase/acylaminoacyl peptidase